MRFLRRKYKEGKCPKCGEFGKVEYYEEDYIMEKYVEYWCGECILANEILKKKEKQKDRKEEQEEQENWRKKRDELLKNN